MIKEDLAFFININNDIATIKNKEDLYSAIFKKLYEFYNLQLGGVTLFDKNKEKLGVILTRLDWPDVVSKRYLWSQTFPLNALPFQLPIDTPKPIFIKSEYFHQAKKLNSDLIPLEETFKNLSIDSLLFIPMLSGGELFGFLTLSLGEYPFNKNEEDYLIKIANLFGSALSNAKSYEELKKKEKEKEMQLRLLSTLVKIKDKNIASLRLADEINRLLNVDYIGLQIKQSESKLFATFGFVKNEKDQFSSINITRSISLSMSALTSDKKLDEETKHYEFMGEELDKVCEHSLHFKQLKEKNSINSFLLLKYVYEGIGELNFILGRKHPLPSKQNLNIVDFIFLQNENSFFSPDEIELAQGLLPHLALVLANIYAFEEIKVLTEKLEQEKSFLLDEINLTISFQEIIGNSSSLQKTLTKVEQVAPLDATVLIQGETGTGKELIARAVHNLSKRNENVFVTVNCAALPTQLIESELFGHEKGSFTGAIEKRIGKFEVANGGTIFLDEIGELPLEIQAKLLRVLQEKEFERLGGRSTIYSDVRIVAATNRDLEKEVEQGKFRSDLFFRLNVFPITLPPLRERTADIPLLAKHFIEKYSKRIGKEVKSIRKTDLDLLMQYDWPGNIRELEHLIERAIIVSDGTNLNLENLLSRNSYLPEQSSENFKTLVDLEKEHILNALKISKGKVTGELSAAQLLGLNGKTLGSKMKKLGIKREVVVISK